jgi:hypothetical protein
MSDEKRREREARAATVATAPVRPVAPIAPKAPIDAGVAAVVVAPIAVPIDAAAAEVVVAPPRAIDAGLVAVAPPRAIDAGVVAVAPPAHAVVVPPTAVHRTSGSLPRINFIDRPGQVTPTSVQAKVCIDAAGHVTTVTIYKITGDVAEQIEDAIKTWRYSPYKAGGAAVPACFVNAFALNK